MKNKYRHFSLYGCCLIIISCIFASCATSRTTESGYTYFNTGLDTVLSQQKEITIQSNDLLGVQVFSKTQNQEQAAIFNMPVISENDKDAIQGYQVSLDGTIVMPVLGSIKVSGLTKSDLQALIVKQLTEGGYVKNPSVIVRFLQFNVNVIGEVRQPGTQKFLVDRVTIIDALSAAGDLTDFGKRENITVIRDEGTRKIYYTVDLRRKDVFASPAYIMKPNDIVYVSPTKNKIKSLNIDPLAQQRRSVVFSIIGIALSAASVILISSRY